MRICFISPSFYPATYYGGPIYSTYNTAKTLAENGIKVFVSTTNINGNKKLNVPLNKFIKERENLYIKYYSPADKRGFSPLMPLFLWKDIWKAEIIYIISVFSPSTPLVLFFSKLFGKKIILSPRGQLGDWALNQGNRFKKHWLSLFIKPLSKKIIWDVTSEQERKTIMNIFSKPNVFVIPNSIDLSDYKLEINKKDSSVYLKLTRKDLSDKKILVSLSRLHKIKGFDILINAFNLLKDKFPELVLLIAGEDFGEKKNLEKLIHQLNLTERVFLTGNIEGKAKADFLINADFFALASHHENFGVVYAEAMAAGLPVIASKNTPWQEVEKYGCGKWVENTPEAFAEAIQQILESDFRQMGKRGRDFVAAKFSSQVIAKEYIKLFNSLVH